MATIFGSQFNATAGVQPVNVVITNDGLNGTNGQPLGSDTIGGDFNLEVYEGPAAGAPSSPFAGYQGLAILAPGGYTIDLINGAYAVTDNGTGGDTIDAEGTNETITGGAAFTNLILSGNNDVANGGIGPSFFDVFAQIDIVNAGAGNAAINVNNTNDTVNAGSGSDTISILAGSDSVHGGSGPDTITATGNDETVTGGSGAMLVNVVGNNSVITGGSSGADTLNVFGTGDTVNGGSGADTIGLYGNGDIANGGAGGGTITATGSGDTVNAGPGNLFINALGSNFQFNDTTSVYNDTIVGFSQPSGDRIHLTTDTVSDALAHTTLVNSGQDSLITLSDGSTILLKGVTSVTNSFFN